MSPLPLNDPEVVIALVEDNPDDEKLALRALARSGLSNPIVVLRDGREALDYFFGRGDQADRGPHLVLLDLKLPEIDGLEVLRRLRGEPLTRLTPIVILTSSIEERDRVESYGLGANSYIQKPVDLGQFMDVISQIGYYWLVVNVPPPR